MNPIFINGVGIISRCAQNSGELLQLVKRERKDFGPFGEKLLFQSAVPPAKLRRCPRYIRMAVSSAALAAEDGKLPEAGRERTGTIISTGFGAVESNVAFADSVVRGNPALCSPSVFSATVPNSCVGQICMVQGYKGFSTILTAGDPVEYAALLLNTERADHIVCGAVEEYNEELTSSLKQSGILREVPMSEGSVMLALSSERTAETWCRVTGFSSASLPAYPYIHQTDPAEAEEALTEALGQMGTGRAPDIILTQKNGTYFDAVEEAALRKVFGPKAVLAASKRLFGETLGCGYLLNVGLGAAMLRANDCPEAIQDEMGRDGRSTGAVDEPGGCFDVSDRREIRTILSAGLDAHGNYLIARLERAEQL